MDNGHLERIKQMLQLDRSMPKPIEHPMFNRIKRSMIKGSWRHWVSIYETCDMPLAVEVINYEYAKEVLQLK